MQLKCEVVHCISVGKRVVQHEDEARVRARLHHQRLVSCSGRRSALGLVNSKCEQALDECEEREGEKDASAFHHFSIS